MKSIIFMVAPLLPILLCACTTANDRSAPIDPVKGDSFSLSQHSLSTHGFVDVKTGMPVYWIDYPSSWEVNSKAIYPSGQDAPYFLYRITGPNGIMGFNQPIKSFNSYSDPRMMQFGSANGTSNLRSFRPIEQLLREDIAPEMQRQGFTYEGPRELPQLERLYKQKVHESAQMPIMADLKASVWSNANGQMSLVIIGLVKIQQQFPPYGTMDYWSYGTDILIVDKNKFDQAVNDVVNAQMSFKENQEWKQYIAKVNLLKREQAAQQSQLAHQRRMEQQRNSFNAHQERMRGISAAQDASHASFMNRTFGTGSSGSVNSYDGHQSFLNTIRGEETVTHPNGNSYQIEAGAKEYWMDSDGNYIKSDDLFYNPNADRNLDPRNWDKVYGD